MVLEYTEFKFAGFLIGLILFGSVIGLSVYQEVSVEVLPGFVSVFSPVSGEVYDTRMVPINISMSDNATFRYAKYSDNGDPLVTLCRECNKYGFDNLIKKPFTDGFHEMRIVAVFDSGTVESKVSFFIDSKEPRIINIFPKEEFALGDFYVFFNEANTKEILLNYGNEDIGFRSVKVDLEEDCIQGPWDYGMCRALANLEDYDGSTIEYWFNISDITGKNDVFDKRKVKVDLTKPFVNNFDFIVNKKRVDFIFDITEENFKNIEYVDNNELGSKWRKLCTYLDNGNCERKISFSAGEHILSFRVNDKAGNVEVIEGIRFVVE